MPAILTRTMSQSIANELLENILTSDNKYYIGIGKSDPYNTEDVVTTPVVSQSEEFEFRQNLQSIKRVEGATFVTRRVNWSSGSFYSGWTGGTTQYSHYVLNDAKEVYVCLSPGITQTGELNVSTVEPNYGVLQVDYTQPFTTPDGYTWKFLFSITPERIFQFLSSNYIPVERAHTIETGDPVEDLQVRVRDTAIGGQIISLTKVSGGLGYTDAPTITITGDGTGATATAHISNGMVTKIDINSFGSGYTYAKVEISGSNVEPAEYTAVITDSNGLGFDPIADLNISSVMLNIKPNGTEGDTFIVENEFRQIGVLRNLLDDTGTVYTGLAAKVLPSITLQNEIPYTVGSIIQGASSESRAYVNEVVGNVVYFHQNQSTGYGEFIVGESIQQTGLPISSNVASISKVNGVNRNTGDVLYIENRARIRRDAEQQEDIKVVITI